MTDILLDDGTCADLMTAMVLTPSPRHERATERPTAMSRASRAMPDISFDLVLEFSVVVARRRARHSELRV